LLGENPYYVPFVGDPIASIGHFVAAYEAILSASKLLSTSSMHYHALAADYDGTLATDGVVDEATVESLHRLKESGRRLVLVTGRIIEQLTQVFPQLALCDLVVADNGALLFNPKTGDKHPLAEPPPREFIEELARRGVPRIEVGDVIVATWEPHETTVLRTIHDMGLELQIIFNKGAVMILPTGVNKATGLRAALTKLGLSHHNTVAVGDAENDEAFLKLCGASAAVENALDVVKKLTDLVMQGARGNGVRELIDKLLDSDLKQLHHRPGRGILMGTDLTGHEIRIPVYGTRVLVTGEPAGGKSKLALTVLEQLTDQCYQTCVIDPEGDYQQVKEPIVLGTIDNPPAIEDVLHVLEDPVKSCVISMFGVPTDEQPPVFAKILRALMEHRSRTGRPHWYLIDEAHYPLSAKWQPTEDLHLDELRSAMYITAFMDQLPEAVLHGIDLFIAIGDEPAEHLAKYSELIGERTPELAPPLDQQEHRAIAWWRRDGKPAWFRRPTPPTDQPRHLHGYLDGDMSREDRFYFRGPNGKLNLAAQNLRVFMQLGEGVDDETWNHHLCKGDYARWFHDVLQDEDLAKRAEGLSNNGKLPAAESRSQLFDFIRKKYAQEA
jgi:hydroxymethylpyrimidine pyrophosphatase-like HAD family hydrolase